MILLGGVTDAVDLVIAGIVVGSILGLLYGGLQRLLGGDNSRQPPSLAPPSRTTTAQGSQNNLAAIRVPGTRIVFLRYSWPLSLIIAALYILYRWHGSATKPFEDHPVARFLLGLIVAFVTCFLTLFRPSRRPADHESSTR